MKSHRLFSAVALACLFLPAMAFAQPPENKDAKDRPAAQSKGRQPKAAPANSNQARGAGGGNAREEGAQPQPQRAARPAPVARPVQAERPNPPAPGPTRERDTTPAPRPAQRGPDTAPARTGVAPRNAPAQVQAQQRPPVRTTGQPAPYVHGPAPQALAGWNPPARGPQRDQAGMQWRQTHQSWDGGSPWRQSADWWRADSGFRLFTGMRIGFFFVPQIGYISEPRQYRGRHWGEGQYLPAWYRTYRVTNYARYGLPRPPRCCAWVWLNGDVALVDLRDGYILDIAHNVW